MVRTVTHVEDEETRDSSSPSEKGVDQKVNAIRSKHSETEQRRRSKINERFQVLRDLIPENDQKRDKASFLLEVIQYIQYLHEKLQMYEGSCQGWSPESAKSFPWRINSGPAESFVDQSQLERNHLSGHHADNNVIHPTLLSNSVEPDLAEAALYAPTDNSPLAATRGLPLNMPLQTSLFEGLTGQPHQGPFNDSHHLTNQSQNHIWPGRSTGDDCSVPIYAANEEELNTEGGESSISNACSQELLNSLTSALQSSGVDLSEAVISVQLDIGKRANSLSPSATFGFKDHKKSSILNYAMNPGWNNECPQKRFKPNQS